MKTKTEVKITEAELRAIIINTVNESTGLTVSELIFRTGVRGDYDKGNASEYVQEVICIIK